MNPENNIKLRERFVSDYNLPISVLDSPYFEYQLELFNDYNSANEKWLGLLLMIKLHYDNNENLFLEDYYSSRNKIITNVENSAIYKEFITVPMDMYNISDKEYIKIPKTSIYTKENDNKRFLSIDLKHANFQSLRYYREWLVNFAENYKDFIKYHLGKEHPLVSYFSESKYSRQVIFGKLNVKRSMTIQNYILYRILTIIQESKLFEHKNIKLYSKEADELIFEFEGMDATFQVYENLYGKSAILLDDIQERLGIKINTELFTLKSHVFKTPKNVDLVVYEKKELFCNDKTNNIFSIGKLKGCPLIYFPQVYTLLIGEEISGNDMVFCYEKNLAKFLEPIKIK